MKHERRQIATIRLMMFENLQYRINIFFQTTRNGYLAIWLYGYVAMRLCGYVVMWLLFSSKRIPTTPQHTDSHPCTRLPTWGTRGSLGEGKQQKHKHQTNKQQGLGQMPMMLRGIANCGRILGAYESQPLAGIKNLLGDEEFQVLRQMPTNQSTNKRQSGSPKEYHSLTLRRDQ